MKNKYKYGSVDFKEYFKKNSKEININLEDIKNDTILSLFNDKETLLKFLINLDTNLKVYQTIVENEFTKIKSDINSINDNVSQLDLNVETLNDNVASINDNIETLNENVETIETNVDNSIPMQLWSNDANFNPNEITPYNKYNWTKLEEGRFIKATTTDNKVNTNESETLPNIEGSLSPMLLKGDRREVNKVGAFEDTEFEDNKWGGTNSGAATNLKALKFNASKSNPVYKNNAKVQPNCVNLVCWLRGTLK